MVSQLLLSRKPPFVPLRGTFERLDAEVEWLQVTREVKVTGRLETRVSLKVASRVAMVDGHKVS